MGNIEKAARKQRRRRNLQKTVLGVVAVAGILAIAMVAPNIFQAIPRITGNKYKFAYRAKTAAGRLAQKGLVRFVERGGKKYVEITHKGQRALALEEQKTTLQNQRGRRWDKRWRMVMFDIPERRKSTRNKLRLLMQELGFLRLQDSVWIYPHDCEELIALMKAEMFIGSNVLYAIAEQVENDGWIKRHFRLS